MRLFLLPISTRRTLIYCQRPHAAAADATSWLEKGRIRAAGLWASWEKKESGWQRKVVDYGNQALKRIPYEEWGLKSIPAMSTRRKENETSGREKIEVSFPSSLIPESEVMGLLKTLGTARQGLHKSKMIWSIVGMPLVAPFALVPVIPNLPFFYLVFRAWSHYTALAGSKHLAFLVDQKLIRTQPSPILDSLYRDGKQPFGGAKEDSQSPADEKMVLRAADSQRFADALEFPELHLELTRAVWQVEKALKLQAEQTAQGEKQQQQQEKQAEEGSAAGDKTPPK